MKIPPMLLLCFFLISIFITSLVADTLLSNQTIQDGQTTVSAAGSFELGFFSPENSSRRYLGIWYKRVSNGTVVWVANREIPLNDTSGTLKIDQNGILILSNHNNSTVWSTNTSGPADNPVAQLLDSGNLVVRNGNDLSPDSYLWQSFDEPDSTFLPGMKLGKLASGLYVYISSWRSDNDPAIGNFTFSVDPEDLEVLLKEGSVVKNRVGPWNGYRFSGMPNLNSNTIYNYTFFDNQNEAYYTYNLLNTSVFTRMVLSPDGKMERLTWVDQISNWISFLTAPADNCDNYGICGANGVCDISNSPVCDCLDRFVPKNQNNWNSADWSSGCVRRTDLDCQRGDGFIQYSGIKLPDTENATINASMSLEECRVMCLNNCSCMAYSSLDITGSGSGCILWPGNLIDIRDLPETGQDLYIRMASSELVVPPQESSSGNRRTIVLSTVLPTVIILLGIGLFLWKKKKKKKEKSYRSNRPRTWEVTTEESNSVHNQDNDLELPQFDLSTIANATNSFSFENMLGEGGFGPVYKGKLKDGQEIAVKRLSKDSRQGLDEFKNEVTCIAKLQHRNLVKLLGYCIQLQEKMLIYEYMPNKSLDFYFSDQTRRMSLDWPKRFHIINGISRGLLYLHQDSRLRIIHRDLKLSNVLLDSDMNPKISDFGMARIFGGNETAANTNRVVGTYGYMAPEYTIDGLFSTKSDVFSFGVLVLEIVSSRRNRGFSHPDHQLNLVGHAWTLFKEGRYLELIDPLILDSCKLPEVLRSIHVGLLCVQHSPEDRPSMSSVVLMLGGEGQLPQPKEPGFFTDRKVVEAESSSSKHETYSVNDVTMTMIDPR